MDDFEIINKLLPAYEVKRETEKNRQKLVQEEILAGIANESANGNMVFCYFRRDVPQEIINSLREKGYTVSPGEGNLYIRWE